MINSGFSQRGIVVTAIPRLFYSRPTFYSIVLNSIMTLLSHQLTWYPYSHTSLSVSSLHLFIDIVKLGDIPALPRQVSPCKRIPVCTTSHKAPIANQEFRPGMVVRSLDASSLTSPSSGDYYQIRVVQVLGVSASNLKLS